MKAKSKDYILQGEWKESKWSCGRKSYIFFAFSHDFFSGE